MCPAPRGTGVTALSLSRERIRDLFTNLPLAMAGQEEPIHEIRVAARRLRVILPLTVPRPTSRRARRALRGLRGLTRTGGASRDLDVAVRLLPRLAGAGDAVSGAGALIRRRVRDARRRSRDRLREGLLDFDIAELRRDLRRITMNGGEDLTGALARVRAMRDAEGAVLLAEMTTIRERFDPEALHRVRSRIRRLRYAAESGAALAATPPEAARRFQAVQDQLGELNDAWVLARWLGRQKALAGSAGRAAETAEAGRLESACDELAHALHRKYLESVPIEAVRRALVLVGRSLSVA